MCCCRSAHGPHANWTARAAAGYPTGGGYAEPSIRPRLPVLHIAAPGTRARVSAATSHFVLSFNALSGSAVHALRGDFAGTGGRVVPLAIVVIAGAQAGAALSTRIGGPLIARLLVGAL